MASKKPNARKQLIDQSSIEAFRDLGRDLIGSVADDLGKGTFSSLWEQLGAKEPQKQEQSSKGDLKEGEELVLNKLQKKQEAQKRNIEPGLDYVREIVHGENRATKEDSREIQVKIQEILIEVRQLMATSEELQIQFKEVALEQRIENPGEYHLSFFKWMLTIIHATRLKIEDSQAWLSAFQSKKGKKQYWSMFKKHGTTFGLSNERVVATQTG